MTVDELDRLEVPAHVRVLRERGRVRGRERSDGAVLARSGFVGIRAALVKIVPVVVLGVRRRAAVPAHVVPLRRRESQPEPRVLYLELGAPRQELLPGQRAQFLLSLCRRRLRGLDLRRDERTRRPAAAAPLLRLVPQPSIAHERHRGGVRLGGPLQAPGPSQSRIFAQRSNAKHPRAGDHEELPRVAHVGDHDGRVREVDESDRSPEPVRALVHHQNPRRGRDQPALLPPREIVDPEVDVSLGRVGLLAEGRVGVEVPQAPRVHDTVAPGAVGRVGGGAGRADPSLGRRVGPVKRGRRRLELVEHRRRLERGELPGDVLDPVFHLLPRDLHLSERGRRRRRLARVAGAPRRARRRNRPAVRPRRTVVWLPRIVPALVVEGRARAPRGDHRRPDSAAE